jgi:chromosome segregation ATPase
MSKFLRKIIREEMENLFEAMDGGVLDSAMADLQNQITANIKNLEDIEKASEQDIKNKENDIKAKKQLKSQLPTQNADRQGLEREVPAKEKELDKQRKDAENIKKAKTDFEKAQDELKKQQMQIAQSSKSGEGEVAKPVLGTLESPI